MKFKKKAFCGRLNVIYCGELLLLVGPMAELFKTSSLNRGP